MKQCLKFKTLRSGVFYLFKTKLGSAFFFPGAIVMMMVGNAAGNGYAKYKILNS